MHKRLRQPLMLLALLGIFMAEKTTAQYPGLPSSGELLQQMLALPETRSVLYVAAHPDDENTRLLAWLAKEKKVRTGYLSLTRGDGGQNLIGGEQGVELGLIRTQELLAARRMDGAEQFFTRAYDFGYSKTAEETLAKWGKEAVLADVVAIIRKFRPSIIITRFPGDARAGHGHHAASALLAQEAFTAAADPKRFPEQLQQGLQPWKATRILWNTFNFGGNTNTIREGQFRVNVGGFNPLLGKGYGEIASESRSQHKSQGFGVPRQRGRAFEYFETMGGTKPVNDLFDGVDSAGTVQEILARWSKQLVDNYKPLNPQASLPLLMALHKELSGAFNTTGQALVQRKKLDVEKLIAQTAGIYWELTSNVARIPQGDSVTLNLVVNTQTTEDVRIKAVVIDGAAKGLFEVPSDSLDANLPYTASIRLKLPADAALTEPYWLMQPLKNNVFQQPESQLGKPWSDPSLNAMLIYETGAMSMQAQLPVQYKHTDPVKGELFEPLVVLPAEENRYGKDLYVSVNGEPVVVTTELQKPGAAVAITSEKVKPAAKGLQPLTLLKQPMRSHTIAYDHIPPITWFDRQPAQLLNLEVKRTAGLKVAYVPGAGDKVAEALSALGYQVTVLEAKDLLTTDLTPFKTIVTGIRAYNVHPEMAAAYEKLMAYVQQGGHLLVQYNTSNQISNIHGKMGPYPFNISRTRVSEEDAEVTFSQPNHPLLNNPNKIGAADFAGWVQERSIYHADQLAPEYQTLFQMNDKGEAASSGSLITTAFGKGRFTYTGLVFFRQLPAGVAGAYRLLANLVEAK